MLKKLVKYGNSNALVLDRTLLALLNVEEGGLVKLRVEGDTLIVKPQKEASTTETLMVEMDAIHQLSEGGPTHSIADFAAANMKKYCAEVKQDPEAMEKLKTWMSKSKGNEAKMKAVFEEVKEKHQDELIKLESKEFKKSLEMINKKFVGRTTSKEFLDEVLALRLKHAPRIAEMDEEIKQEMTKLGCPVKK